MWYDQIIKHHYVAEAIGLYVRLPTEYREKVVVMRYGRESPLLQAISQILDQYMHNNRRTVHLTTRLDFYHHVKSFPDLLDGLGDGFGVGLGMGWEMGWEMGLGMGSEMGWASSVKILLQ